VLGISADNEMSALQQSWVAHMRETLPATGVRNAFRLDFLRMFFIYARLRYLSFCIAHTSEEQHAEERELLQRVGGHGSLSRAPILRSCSVTGLRWNSSAVSFMTFAGQNTVSKACFADTSFRSRMNRDIRTTRTRRSQSHRDDCGLDTHQGKLA
jgi:hypothetical protein